jgi:hypothetical protein
VAVVFFAVFFTAVFLVTVFFFGGIKTSFKKPYINITKKTKDTYFYVPFVLNNIKIILLLT